MTIEKTYNPAETEKKWYPLWEKSGAFACNPNSKAEPFCIMIPPPNVTGILHMGHGLTLTLQDVLIRFQRMQGRDVLWMPGTDHAGIATQMVVERELAKEGLNRRDMGREAFLKKVWEWKAYSGGTITNQLRRLGASLDWPRERFTMDEGLCKAVTREFVQLYREGFIFKDKRLVNWDPKMLTAISDLEVEQKESKGSLWHFKYPIENSDEFIIVATTRPETMLGDTAVAVHPENERLKHLIGKYVILPLVGRRIPIIGDDYADPEKGTGAVKITPAHDFNDLEVGKRHKLPLINIFDQHAKILIQGNTNLLDGSERLSADDLSWIRSLDKVDRFEARKLIVQRLEALSLLDKVEPHNHVVPHGDRSGVPIEPWLSEQWYCDARKLAVEALKAVEDGRTQFVPQQWENTYYAWMRNIEPWCISRQLWWGHQIPAWYGPLVLPNNSLDPTKFYGSKMFVAENEQEVLKQAKEEYAFLGVDVAIGQNFEEVQQSVKDVCSGKSKTLKISRDEDVFDTWFSSALWPFSTLGWPEQTPELKRYYPTDVLITGFDIIFFWVARMMMMGLHFMKDVPFKKVFIHALVRDEKGQKMSKSKGNVMDPLVIIDKYGCDALRFTLTSLSTPGRDIKLAPARIEGNRNFATKLWNAARYTQMNQCAWKADFDPAKTQHTLNQWIIGETKRTADQIADYLGGKSKLGNRFDFRYDLASSTIYEFVWNTFCDWYLEFTKPILLGTDEAAKAETRATTAWVLAQMLKMLHPFMPYITEELWSQIVGGDKLLISESWPKFPDAIVNQAAQDEVNWVIRLISAVRTTRAELNVPAGAQIQLQIKDASEANKKRLDTYQAIVTRLARLSGVLHVTSAPKGSVQAVLDEATLILPLADVIDIEQERARLGKEADKLAAEIKKLEAKLSNKDFTDRAPSEVVEEHRERKAEAEATIAKLKAAQQSLAG